MNTFHQEHFRPCPLEARPFCCPCSAPFTADGDCSHHCSRGASASPLELYLHAFSPFHRQYFSLFSITICSLKSHPTFGVRPWSCRPGHQAAAGCDQGRAGCCRPHPAAPFPLTELYPTDFFYFYFLIQHHRNLNLRQNGSTKKAAHHCVVSYKILQPPTKPRVFHSVPSFKKCRAHFSTMQQLCCSAQEGT